MNNKQLPVGEHKKDLSNVRNFYCKLKIGKVSINPLLIVSLVVREWIFDILPRLEVVISDDGTLMEVFNIEDQAEITLELAKTNTQEGGIATSFIVDNWSVDALRGNKQFIFTINATLNAKNIFYPIKTRSFKNKTSSKVLEQIAQEGGLTVKTTPGVSTVDSMTWYQINLNNYDMYKHVLKRASVNDDMFLSFIDVDKNLVISSLKKASKVQKSITAKFDIQLTTAEPEDFKTPEDKKIIWYNGYKMENIEGNFNKQFGYGVNYNYYDLTNNIKKVSPSPYHPFTENYYQHGDKVDSINYGMLTDNVFSDYFTSQINNKYYRMTSFGQRLAMSINSLYPIKLLDKVNVVLPSTVKVGEINTVYSGEYIVCGIVHSAKSNGTYVKEISLHRNGFDTPLFEFQQAYLKEHKE